MSHHSQIIDFMHDRFMPVSYQSDCSGVGHATLSECRRGLRSMSSRSWSTYRRWLIDTFAYVYPRSQETVGGWHFGPDGIQSDDWFVFALPGPDCAMIIYEFDGKVQDVDFVNIPKMQRLEHTLVELRFRVQTYLVDAVSA